MQGDHRAEGADSGKEQCDVTITEVHAQFPAVYVLWLTKGVLGFESPTRGWVGRLAAG